MTWQTLGKWAETGSDAAGVILSDVHGRVCLQLRDSWPGLSGAGHWGFFGGQREAGEDLVTTAIREMAEETGLAFSPDDLRPFARTQTGLGLRIHIFTTARLFTPADLRLGEGAGFAFLTQTQVAAGPTLVSTRTILDAWFAAHD